MPTVEKILKEVARLSPEERQVLLERLEDSFWEENSIPASLGSENAYARSLALAGTVHSDFTDLSTEKYKHVAAAIADTGDE